MSFRRVFFAVMISIGAGVGMGTLGLLYVVAQAAGEIPNEREALTRLGKESLALASEVFDRRGRKVGEFAGEKRYYVKLADLPPHVVQAFIAAEDKEFRQHWGVSPEAILRAALANLRGMSLKQGASTITQQLVRMSLLDRRKVWTRKIKEALIAVALETRLSKDEILELYLNRVFLGNRSYGVEAAARNYFRKSAKDLSIGEAALLAGLPKAPSRYAPHRFPKRASTRQEFVLRRMAEDGYITQEEARTWAERPVIVQKNAESYRDKAPYFVQAVRRELARKLEFDELPTSGLKIYTTLDLDIQEAATRAITNGVTAIRRRSASEHPGEIQAALVSLDPKTGGVRAVQGGSSFEDTQFDRTVGTRRRLGSFFLPILAAAAIDQGMPVTTLVSEGSRRRNDPGLTIYDAVVEGRYFEAAQLFPRVGAGTVLDLCRKLGFTFRRDDVLVALGYGRATPMQAAAAYAAFASGGARQTPYLVERVLSADGKILYQRNPTKPAQVMSPPTAEVMNHLLQDAVRHGTAQAAKGIRDDVAAFAGVTDDLHNAWFAGSLPHLTTLVWIGAERGRVRLAASEEEVAALATNLWKDVMRTIPEKIRGVPSQYPMSGRLSFGRAGRRVVPFVTGSQTGARAVF